MPYLNESEHMPAIVNMSSGLADVSNPGYGPYSAAKAAIVSLTKTLAKENAPRIRVNCVAPGGIDTRFMTGGTGRPHIEPRLNPDIYKQQVPLGRLGLAAEVASLYCFSFLKRHGISPARRYISMAVL
ncbi:conserved protein of unknown function [Denitratisoma oestradiolicum]|uniref:Uncharacterized protein n=1 Tax=Denitratisoma oestradiolicum TaxID=311182 RepID=A0A6S6XXG2_9PROT|nr:conserved protein of unknown function [Denitratisoma oestradiolicum]